MRAYAEVVTEDRPNFSMSVICLKLRTRRANSMRVVAPMGVLLPTGLGLKIAQVDAGRTGFVRCLLNGCVADVVLDDNLVKQLRAGQTATFIIFQTPEEGIGIPISLKGSGQLRQIAVTNARARCYCALWVLARLDAAPGGARASRSRLMLTTWAQWNGSTPEIKPACVVIIVK